MVPSANRPSLLDLSQLPKVNRFYIAYSGGIDSTALLHALIQHPDIDNKQLTAIHINHNIHPDSAGWSKHCQSFCYQHQITFISKSVQPIDHSENACRNERLKVFQNELGEKDCLLTGHQLNDQVETVLFRMIRGTGIHGLTGMSKLSKHKHYQVFRPLLSVTRNEIESYIDTHGLSYVVDSSNQQNQYSRNFLRNQVLPLIEEHYPHVFQNVLLTSANLKKSEQLLSQLISNHNPLDIKDIDNAGMLASILYHWLEKFKVPAANHHALEQFATDCLSASHDKLPELAMQNWQLKCWQNQVYLLHSLPHKTPSKISTMLTANNIYNLPYGLGSLHIKSDNHLSLPVTIMFQRPQERIKLPRQKHRQKLKNIFQSMKIPPWERAHMPYLFIDGHLMAVGSEIKSEDFILLLEAHKAEYQWLSPQHLL
ncbi:MAG: tRNA lysidine(34) synthetase TilS [Marinicella sp.]|nr:tRNA lysidine(34) synthetase TilS [Xanthomonadales bacterium]